MTNTPLTDVDTELDKVLNEVRFNPRPTYEENAEYVKAAFNRLIGTIAEQIKREAYCDVGNYAADSGDTKLMDFIDARLSHPAPEDGSATTEAPERLKDYMENN